MEDGGGNEHTAKIPTQLLKRLSNTRESIEGAEYFTVC